MGPVAYIWSKFAHYAELKLDAGLFLAVFGFFFDPLQTAALLSLFILILLDTVYAIRAAAKTGEPITSAKLVRTAYKMAVYFSLISAGHLSENALPILDGLVSKGITGFLVATELISILENAGKMGYAIPISLLARLQDIVGKK